MMTVGRGRLYKIYRIVDDMDRTAASKERPQAVLPEV